MSDADDDAGDAKRRILMRGASLGQAFDPRNNALNAWRLVLAISVILWHSWPLTGRFITFKPLEQFMEQVGVDGFFAVSGFLITSSWLRNPRLREFAVARALRIFPGLWVCVAITAFVLAPVSVLIQHGSVSNLLSSSKPYEYALSNALLYPFYVGIDGTPRDIPWPGVWNGSLWTLIFEMGCYIAVAALGLTGLLNRRWFVPAAFVLTVCATAYFSYPTAAMQTIPQMVFRFAVMFAAGALVYHFREVIPARWSLVGVSVVIVAASCLLANYRVIGALPLAYAVIASGALVRDRRLNLRNDLSYGVYIYAFPMQQMLAVLGAAVLNTFAFFVVATTVTLAPAALSWFLIEKRAIALKSRFLRRRAPASDAEQPVPPPAEERFDTIGGGVAEPREGAP